MLIKSLNPALTIPTFVAMILLSHQLQSSLLHPADDSPKPDNTNTTVPLESNAIALVQAIYPQVQRILTFGQLPLVVDMLWIKGLQDDRVTTKAQWPQGQHPAVYYDFNLATSLDPIFFQAYKAGSIFLSIVRNDFRGGVALLEKGNQWRIEHLPTMPAILRDREWAHEWSIPTSLIYHYLLPLKDLKNGIRVIQEAADLPGVPDYVKSMKAKLDQPAGSFIIGEQVLGMLIQNEQNPLIREELEIKLRELQIAKFLKLTQLEWQALRSKNPRKSSSPEQFLTHKFGQPPKDPWGGQLSIAPDGRITTTTPYEPVYGLDDSPEPRAQPDPKEEPQSK